MSGGGQLSGAQAASLIQGGIQQYQAHNQAKSDAEARELQMGIAKRQQELAEQAAYDQRSAALEKDMAAQGRLDLVDQNINDAVESGLLNPTQAGLLSTLPVDKRAQGLIDATGALAAPASAADMLELEKTQAEIADKKASTIEKQVSARLAEAQISDVGQTTLLRNLKGAGVDPTSEAGQRIIENAATGRQQGADAARIAAERAKAGGRAQASVKREVELAELLTSIDSGTSAAEQLVDLSPEAVSGPFAEQRNALAKAADQFGGRGILEVVDYFIPGDVVPNSPEAGEVFEGIRAQFDLEARALQKGPQTDQDAKIIASTTPQLSDSQEARESKAKRFIATKNVIKGRLQSELKSLEAGIAPAEARRLAVEEFPSPDFDTGGDVAQAPAPVGAFPDMSDADLEAEISRLTAGGG